MPVAKSFAAAVSAVPAVIPAVITDCDNDSVSSENSVKRVMKKDKDYVFVYPGVGKIRVKVVCNDVVITNKVYSYNNYSLLIKMFNKIKCEELHVTSTIAENDTKLEALKFLQMLIDKSDVKCKGYLFMLMTVRCKTDTDGIKTFERIANDQDIQNLYLDIIAPKDLATKIFAGVVKSTEKLPKNLYVSAAKVAKIAEFTEEKGKNDAAFEKRMADLNLQKKAKAAKSEQ